MDPVIIFFLIFISFCLFMIYYTSHQKSKIKKNILNLKNEKNATIFMTLSHFYGLPIAENTITQVLSCPNEYEFLANNNSFKLSKEKVTDISITNDVDIQKNNVSSIGSAIRWCHVIWSNWSNDWWQNKRKNFQNNTFIFNIYIYK